ncbi:hypothetical protein EON80_04005, partial [bacterium]
MSYSRKVSANERLYLAAERHFNHPILQLIVEGIGQVSEEKLRIAVAAASITHPGSRVRLNSKNWTDDGPLPSIIFTNSCPDFKKDFDRSIRLHGQLDTRQVAEVECFTDGERSILVFRCLHAVMDAQGLAIWARAVFSFLRQEQPEPALSTLTDWDFASQLAPSAKSESPIRPTSVGYQGKSCTDNAFSFRRVTVSGIHPGLIARIAVAMRDYFNDPSAVFMLPVDLRPLLQENRTTGNLTLPLFAQSAPQETWEMFYQGLLTAFEEKRYLGIGRIDRLQNVVPSPLLSFALNRLHKQQMKKGRYYANSLISNIGRMKKEDFSASNFKAKSVCFVPIAIPIASTAFIITEHGRQTEICISVASEFEERLDDLIGCLLRETGLRESPEETAAVLGLPLKPMDTPDINERIEAISREFPNRIAMIEGERKLNYLEMMDTRNRLAGILRKRCGDGEIRVAILMNRSIEAVVTILASLKAVAAFLPVDPAYPPERISILLEDSQATLVIFNERDQLPELPAGAISIQELLKDKDDFQNVPSSGPDSLAYLLYTSGTTGRPKGVCITRKNLSNYINWAEFTYLPVNRTHTVPLFTSLSFDLTITSIFTPLVSGGVLKIYPETKAILALRQVLADPDLSVIKMTPSHMQILLSIPEGPASRWLSLVVGGESLLRSTCQAVIEKIGTQLRIFNEYGPTETTVGITGHIFDTQEEDTVAIGGPGAGMTIYILRSDLSPCDP